MKYRCEIEIERPIHKVVGLWCDESSFDQWQDGFQSIEHLQGEPEVVGSKSKIVYQQGKRKIELLETIVSNNLPHEKKALYEHVHMVNTQTTKFIQVSDKKTRFISEVEYTKFKGVVPKLLSILFPGMFKRQSQKWMNQFKDFAEKAN